MEIPDSHNMGTLVFVELKYGGENLVHVLICDAVLNVKAGPCVNHPFVATDAPGGMPPCMYHLLRN